MRLFGSFVVMLILVSSFEVYAQALSARQTHPIAWQHMLPSGEAPGWIAPSWVEFDVVNGNHWAAPTTFLNKKNGKTLTLTADYEQTSIFVEMGKSLSKNWAIALEVPYAARHEGKTSDRVIDKFHEFFDFDNFGRPLYPYGQKIFETTVDGDRRGPHEAPSGAGNLKLKLKYWPVQWSRNTGFGVSAQIKAPIEDEQKGMTSGGYDYSLLLHLAFPLGDQSGVYTTLGATHAPDNWMFKDWPRRESHWMIDTLFDIGISEKWGVILDFAFYSPLMKKKDLDIQYEQTTDKGKIMEKIASAYNSLVEFRGQQMVGLRRKFGKDNFWMFYFLEDWGPGDKDHNNDSVYSTGQPDFALGFKIHYGI